MTSKMVTMELVLSETRFNKLDPGTPFFWKQSKGDNRLWFKAKAAMSAFCIETGEIKYVAPYTRVEEIVGGL